MSYKIAWLVGQALPPNATYFFRRRCSAFVVGRAILPAAAFQAAFSGRERAFARQRPAESRLQPGLAAPQFGLDGLQDQKVCGIGYHPAPQLMKDAHLQPASVTMPEASPLPKRPIRFVQRDPA